MTLSQPVADTGQAVRVGRITAVAHADRASLRILLDRFTAHDYQCDETPHFAICRSPRGSRLYLLHTFTADTVDEDLSVVVADELDSSGAISSDSEFGDALFAVVASTSPPSLLCPDCGRLHLDNPALWRQFNLNTLAKLRALLGRSHNISRTTSHIVQFAAIYQRVMDSIIGDSVLDVATNLGLMPVLMSERFPNLTVVGCDNRPDAIACANDLISATHVDRVQYVVQDVLATDFDRIGSFDTVTAVHLLEHLPEDSLPIALANMLRVSHRRLIVAVPYEESMQPLYGHQQVFTPHKLATWGQWCVESMRSGSYRCEDVHGGLLVVDRADSPS